MMERVPLCLSVTEVYRKFIEVYRKFIGFFSVNGSYVSKSSRFSSSLCACVNIRSCQYLYEDKSTLFCIISIGIRC